MMDFYDFDPVIDMPPGYILGNPYKFADDFDPVIDMPPSNFLENPYKFDEDSLSGHMMYSNPYKVDPAEVSGSMMYSNPYSCGMPADDFIDMMHATGKISDEGYYCLLNMFPRHSHSSGIDTSSSSEVSSTQAKLDESSSIERARDTAVDNYNDAKRSGNVEEMLKWETIANDRQQDLYNLWDTTQYGLPAKAPGIA